MERPHYWVDDKIASAYSMNITSNSVPDKNVENEIDKLKNGNKQNKKEIYLNKSTDSKATARPEDKTQTKILDSKPKKVVEEKREDSLSVQKTILKEKSLNKDKQNSVPMKDNKLKTLMETEEEKNSVIVIIKHEKINNIHLIFVRNRFIIKLLRRMNHHRKKALLKKTILKITRTGKKLSSEMK